MSIGNKYAYQAMYFKPVHPKKKIASTRVHMTNSAAEVVLRERQVEIKDLESKVHYYQNQVKVYQIENKTLKQIQVCNEKELRKYREGVADIPSLLRSHKDEIKVVESNASSLRRELRDCQKFLKTKCDAILRKDQQIEKLTASSKRHEKQLNELTAENKELKTGKKKLEEENKKLVNVGDETKSKNERFQKKIQQMTNKILNLEESLGSAEHHETQLKEDLIKLQKSYDELKQRLLSSESQTLLSTKEIQTELSYIEEPKSSKYLESSSQSTTGAPGYVTIVGTNSKESFDINGKDCDINSLGDCYKTLMRMEEKAQKSFPLKPLKAKSSLPLNFDLKPCFSLSYPYLPTGVSDTHCSVKKMDKFKATHYKKL